MILSRGFRHWPPQTVIYVLFVIFSFLAPPYHNHDYSSDYHFDTGGHLPDHHDSSENRLSKRDKHASPHLHLKKDFRVEWTRNILQSRLQKIPLNIVERFDSTRSFITFRYLCSFDETGIHNPFIKVFAGLSPPVC